MRLGCMTKGGAVVGVGSAEATCVGRVVVGRCSWRPTDVNEAPGAQSGEFSLYHGTTGTSVLSSNSCCGKQFSES